MSYADFGERFDLEAAVEAISDGERELSGSALQKVRRVIQLLDRGKLRVATKESGTWQVHPWIKQAILLYFKISEMKVMEVGPFEFRDKIPLKSNLEGAGVRAVPGAIVRYGSFVENGVILMPSLVNIGAWVGSGTMVDTWATVGSCAQIGRNVHLAGGVGIGGVLEPPQAQPVIVEDNVFVGSRAAITEGFLVEEEAVIAAGVSLTASTHIIDVSGEFDGQTFRGRVPPRAVVVDGVRSREFPRGTAWIRCAYIIGTRSESTDKKVSLEKALRKHDVAG